MKKITVKTKKEVEQTVKTNAATPEQYAAERFQNKARLVANDSLYLFNKTGKKSVADTKKNIQSAQITLKEIKAKRDERKAKSKAKQNAASTGETAKNPAESIFNTTPEKAVYTKTEAVKNAPKTKSIQANAGNHSAVKNTEKTIKAANSAPAKTAFETKATSTTKSTVVMPNAKRAAMSNRLELRAYGVILNGGIEENRKIILNNNDLDIDLKILGGDNAKYRITVFLNNEPILIDNKYTDVILQSSIDKYSIINFNYSNNNLEETNVIYFIALPINETKDEAYPIKTDSVVIIK